MDNPAFFDESRASEKETSSFPIYTFEEAITLTKVGKFHYLLLLISGLCFMSVMIEIMSIGLVIPLAKCDLESSIMEQGFLASASFLGIVMSSHAMGFLADTWGRVRTLRYALCLSALSTVISAFSVNIWMLIVFRFFTGFFIAGGQACIFSLCGEFHGRESRVRHVTLLSGFLPIALIYLPAIAILILPLRIDLYILGLKFSSWRCLFLANAAFTCLAVVGLFSLPETPKYVLAQGDEDTAVRTLQKIFARNTGFSEAEFPVKHLVLKESGASLSNVHSIKDGIVLIWNQTVPLFNRSRCLHTINISFIMFVVYGMSQGIFIWFPSIFNEMVAKDGTGELVCDVIINMDVSVDSAALKNCENVDSFMYKVLIVIGIFQCILFLIVAYTIDYLGKKNLLMGYIATACLCVTGIHWTSSFPVAIIFLTLIMSVGNCGAVLSTIAMEFYPTNINAMGMCFIMMIGRLGAAIGSNFIGPILLEYCNIFFWVLTAVLCLLFILGYFLPEKRRQKEIFVNS